MTAIQQAGKLMISLDIKQNSSVSSRMLERAGIKVLDEVQLGAV